MENLVDDEVIKAFVFNVCAEKPYLLPDIIKMATQGVEEFARRQDDRAGKLSFMMSQVLTECPQKNFGPFSRKDVLNAMTPLHGTKWMEAELKSLEG